MKTWLKLSLLLFCCVAFVQCQKEEKKDCTVYHTGAESYLVSFFRFLPGTSWNYINENTSDTSNIFVLSNNDHAEYVRQYDCIHYYKDVYEIYLSDGNKFQLSGEGITLTDPSRDFINYLSDGHFGGTFLDTLTLPTGNYFSVYKYQGYFFGQSSYLDSSYYYFNEAYGIVRKELYQGHGQYEIWNLSSSTIVR